MPDRQWHPAFYGTAMKPSVIDDQNLLLFVVGEGNPWPRLLLVLWVY
jgi:hypothetical protein